MGTFRCWRLLAIWEKCSKSSLQSVMLNRFAAVGLGLLAVSLIASVPTSAQSNCDPSYPDVCIPSPPPDLDCRDISYRNFEVLQPDPHHFDGDEDGVGCEGR